MFFWTLYNPEKKWQKKKSFRYILWYTVYVMMAMNDHCYPTIINHKIQDLVKYSRKYTKKASFLILGLVVTLTAVPCVLTDNLCQHCSLWLSVWCISRFDTWERLEGVHTGRVLPFKQLDGAQLHGTELWGLEMCF